MLTFVALRSSINKSILFSCKSFFCLESKVLLNSCLAGMYAKTAYWDVLVYAEHTIVRYNRVVTRS